MSSEHLSVKQWDEADRPREKLADRGAENLSSAELLAILIGSGSSGESAVALMRRIMNDCNGSLRKMGRMSIEELCQYKGIGKAKAITLLAACEIARRRAEEPMEQNPRMQNAADIYNYYRERLEEKITEEFHVMLLNQNLRFINSVCIAKGGLTATIADVRIILREAIVQKAPCIAVCHNHPSGNTKPSSADNQLTLKIKQAAELMDIRLVDHVIVGYGKYYSYQEEGKI